MVLSTIAARVFQHDPSGAGHLRVCRVVRAEYQAAHGAASRMTT